MRYTYSRWDGAQAVAGPDPDAVLDALADSFFNDGDLNRALADVVRDGIQTEANAFPGLQEVLEELQERRAAELETYDLDSAMTDIRKQLEEVVEAERSALDRLDADLRSAPEAERAPIEALVARRREALAGLSHDVGEAVEQLAGQELLDDMARVGLDALLDTLQQHVLRRHFQSMEQSIGALTGAQLEDFKAMLRALDKHLDGPGDGAQEFASFMSRFGQHLPDAASFEDLLAHMQQQSLATESLLQSMAPDMRRDLEATLASVLRDDELRTLLARVTDHVERRAIHPSQAYSFSGDQSITLDEALHLMRRMAALDRLERQLQGALETGDVSDLDLQQVTDLVGPAGAAAIEQLRAMRVGLEEVGYARSGEGGWELTARGIHRIGARAVDDIFRHLRHSTFGDHPSPVRGSGADRSDESKAYEYGDVFLLDMHRTLMNALVHAGPGTPVSLGVEDFEVFRTEQLTRSATVLMLDMSRSMPLRGCYAAAQKVTLALNSLIRTKFPRDALYVVGFSDLARQMRPEALHHVQWSECVYGTNMQHGFMVARKLLGRHRDGTRQIVLITDGEPTAHLEGTRVQFAYPPTFRTFEATLREVRRCTDEGIVINTFMLDRSHYLADFVKRMTRINGGRAFFATPDRLGDYILLDYVQSRGTAPGRLSGRA